MFSATISTGHEHEVLVDHADAAGDRIRRSVDLDGRRRRAGSRRSSGRRQPVQDVHQGRLAGAVLAEQGVDLAGPDVEVDPVVRDDAGIALGDPAHLERGGGHGLGHGLGHGGLGRIADQWTGEGTAGVADIIGARIDRGAVLRPPLGRASRWTLSGWLGAGHRALDRRARIERSVLEAREGRVELGLDLRRDQRRVVVERRQADGLRRRRRVVGDGARLERVRGDAQDDGLDRVDELLLGARDDALREVREADGLVDVDADAPDAGLARRPPRERPGPSGRRSGR